MALIPRGERGVTSPFPNDTFASRTYAWLMRRIILVGVFMGLSFGAFAAEFAPNWNPSWLQNDPYNTMYTSVDAKVGVRTSNRPIAPLQVGEFGLMQNIYNGTGNFGGAILA